MRVQEHDNAALADTALQNFASRLRGELLLPCLETAGPAAALGGFGLRAQAYEHGQAQEGGSWQSFALDHRMVPRFVVTLARLRQGN